MKGGTETSLGELLQANPGDYAGQVTGRGIGGHMLYLGHFSFDRLERRRRSSEAWHGYFTCVVESDDIDSALADLQRLILTLRETNRELFADVAEVQLEACVEIRSVPRAGFLAFYNVLEGENRGGIATAIRGATGRQAVAVRIGAPDEQDTDEGHEVGPFITFERGRTRAHRPSAFVRV